MSLLNWPKLCAPPSKTPLLGAVSLFQLMGAATAFKNEQVQGNETPYSKFADAKKLKKPISGRVSMLIIYLPAAAYATYAFHALGGLASLDASAGNRPTVVAAMLSAHFIKRCLEALFVHKYSNSGDLFFSLAIGVNYFLQSLLINSQQVNVAVEDRLPWALDVGSVLFAVGQLGNLYHHWLLATLRPKAPAEGEPVEKKYSVPQGGFFRFVTMPHYFFELIAWAGIAVTAQQANAWLVLANMTSYLAGRSVATTRWYKEKVPGYPEDRKNLIPFLF